MQRIIKTHITDNKIKDRQKLIEDFVAEGFTMANADNLEFIENHNFTTHSGKNRLMLFSTLLKGNLSFDFENDVIKWYLNIDSLIFKTSLTFILITLRDKDKYLLINKLLSPLMCKRITFRTLLMSVILLAISHTF